MSFNSTSHSAVCAQEGSWRAWQRNCFAAAWTNSAYELTDLQCPPITAAATAQACTPLLAAIHSGTLDLALQTACCAARMLHCVTSSLLSDPYRASAPEQTREGSFVQQTVQFDKPGCKIHQHGCWGFVGMGIGSMCR